MSAPLQLKTLPQTLPKQEAVSIELVEGIPIFRASQKVQNRLEYLLEKQKQNSLNSEEEKELDNYEELDDYLSLVNRTIRNLHIK
jgi:hypothetical protein